MRLIIQNKTLQFALSIKPLLKVIGANHTSGRLIQISKLLCPTLYLYMNRHVYHEGIMWAECI